MKGFTLVEVVVVFVILMVLASVVVGIWNDTMETTPKEYEIEIIKNNRTVRRYTANKYSIEGNRIIIEIDK